VKFSGRFSIVAAVVAIGLALQALPPLESPARAADPKPSRQTSEIAPNGGEMKPPLTLPEGGSRQVPEVLDLLHKDHAPQIDKATPRPKAEDLPVPPELSDPQARALAEAQSTGKRVEIVERRTEAETTWANPQGTLSTEISSGAVRVKKGDKLVPVDTTLEVAGDAIVPKAPRAS
jgi:hypothetical protein